MKAAIAIVLAVTLLALAGPSPAQTFELSPIKDNTLYEVEPDTVALSNGQGAYLFVGNTARGDSRRAVLAFDLSVIPPQSTITDASSSTCPAPSSRISVSP